MQQVPPHVLSRAGALAELRDAAWLSPHRARVWSGALAFTMAAIAVGWAALAHHGLDRFGRPLGADFISFWTASQLALAGDVTNVYNPAAHFAAQKALNPEVGGAFGYAAFFYPPVFLLLCLPLALLPYVVSWVVWVTAGYAAVFACLRRVLPQRWAIMPIATYPALLINALNGQNGFLSTACFGGAMLLMVRRPVLAGMCLGALVFKPHLLVAAPVLLLAARRWRVIVGALGSSLGLILLSCAVLGADAWRGFAQVSPMARETLEHGWVEPGKMQSVFSAVRVLHGGLGLAYAAQAGVALAVALVLARRASARPGAHAEGALLAAAAPLCTPFLLDYDLVCLALPLAWVMADAQRTGWRPWEKLALLCAYVTPLFIRPLALKLNVPLAPLVMAGLFFVVARRARVPDQAERRVFGRSLAWLPGAG